MTATPTLRAATLDDLAALLALIESAYRGDASRAGWTTEADLVGGNRTDAAEIRGYLEDPRSRIIVADDGGRLIGCARVAIEAGAGYFGLFAVTPGGQNRGLGSHLLAEAERVARDEWRLATMHMSVIAIRAELIAYYQRRGYAPTGAYQPFPYDDPRVRDVARPDLRFAILEKRL